MSGLFLLILWFLVFCIQEESSQTQMMLPAALKGLYILSVDFCEWLVCVHVWRGSILGKRHLDLGGWKLTCSTEPFLLTRGCSLPPRLSLALQMSSLPQFAQLSKYLKLCKLIITWSSLWLLLRKQRAGRWGEWPTVVCGTRLCSEQAATANHKPPAWHQQRAVSQAQKVPQQEHSLHRTSLHGLPGF